MAQVVIRSIPEEVHLAIRARAKRSGRSVEAEIRKILADAVLPDGGLRLGSLLVGIGRQADVGDSDVDVIDGVRDRTPAEPMEFG